MSAQYLKIVLLAAAAVILAAAAAGAAVQAPADSAATAADTLGAAADPAENVFMPGGAEMNMPALLAKVAGYFLLIVAMIFGFVYFLKKVVYNKREWFGKQDIISVVSSTHVAPKKSLMIVEALDKVLVLGVTENSMNLVTELDREQYEEYVERSNGKKQQGGAVVQENQFGEMLNRILKRAK